MNIIEWLFENTKALPQLGWANSHKTAIGWRPGNTVISEHRAQQIAARATFSGCTQLAFLDYMKPQNAQPCKIVHIDIDLDDPIALSDSQILDILPPVCSLRASCGGLGRHILIRLAEPIPCLDVKTASKLVKALTEPFVKLLEANGVTVCKADRRMFWLVGGLNREIFTTSALYTPPEIPDVTACTPATPCCKLEGFHPEIATWLQRFGVTSVSERNPIYIGSIVDVLRQHGENVRTKSPCSGNGHVNGYLDVTETFLGVWAYADGGYIWRYSVGCL